MKPSEISRLNVVCMSGFFFWCECFCGEMAYSIYYVFKEVHDPPQKNE